MKPLFSSLVAIAALVPSSILQGQDSSLRTRLAARRDLERAKTDLLYYWQVDYPRKCRELDAAIEITRTEIDDNRSLLREYQPFSGFSIGEPFPITTRNIQLCIRTGELRLSDLLAERSVLMRFHGDEFQTLSSRIYEARLRVAEADEAEQNSEVSVEQLPAK
jgi:hypothetical protein